MDAGSGLSREGADMPQTMWQKIKTAVKKLDGTSVDVHKVGPYRHWVSG